MLLQAFPVTDPTLLIHNNTDRSFSREVPVKRIEEEDTNQMEAVQTIQSWVSKNKLASIGTLWASGIGASLAYSTAKTPLKPSLRLIHARMHAQALTLGVLSAAAIFHYYEERAEQDQHPPN